MEIVWESPGREVTGRQVADALPEYAYTTVATVLDRLAHKAVLRRRMVERTIRFTSAGSKGAYTAVLMHDALAQDRDPHAALRHFVEGLSESETAVLRQLLTT
jgi:predicted transcriptional regulator